MRDLGFRVQASGLGFVVVVVVFFVANDGCSRPIPVLPDNPASSSVPLPSNIRSWPKTFEAKLPGQC